MPPLQPLPPLSAVRAFESAARHGSFTRAADELGMTQAAVSYQIRQLEDRAGMPLFQRLPRGVALTSEGAQLATRATEALDLLRQAFADLRRSSEETLVISVIAAFAAAILGPRLWRFQAAHPDIATRIDINQNLVDLTSGDTSVAIRVGSGDWPGLRCDRLMRAQYAPMISPAYLDRHGPLHQPSDLLTAPRVAADDPAWTRWFELAGLTPPPQSGRQRSSLGSQMVEVQAAKAGQGVTLLTPLYYQQELARGELIQPFDIVAESDLAVWLVHAEHRRKSPAVRAFRRWLLAEMRDLGANGGSDALDASGDSA